MGFENTCTVSGKWNISRVVPRLYGWVYKILKATPFIGSTTSSHQRDSHSAGPHSVVVTADSQSGVQVRILWVTNFPLPLYEICAQNGRHIKFWDLDLSRGLQDFFLLSQGFESFSSDLKQVRWRNLVRVECL